MSRYRASFIHLLVSALVLGNVVAVIYWIWYPPPAFEVAGAFSIVQMLIGIDLILGPLLTLVVYKHGKPGLKIDLSVIAAVQIAALIYGAQVMYVERPQFLVFAVDRVELISGKEIDESMIRHDQLKDKRFARLTQVFARFPEGEEEQQRFLDSVMFEGQPDLEVRPEYWEPWAAGLDVIRRNVLSLEEIDATTPQEEQNVQEAINEYGGSHPHLGVIPMGGTEKDIGLLVDRDTLQILDVLAANPWR